MVLFYKWNHDGYQALIAFVGIMICCLSSKGIISWLFNRSCFRMAEKLSLSVYLNHAMIISIIGMPDFSEANKYMLITGYVLIVTLYSFVFIKVVDISKVFVEKILVKTK